MIIAGIDEAGRGPCIGPMVLAIATIEAGKEPKLEEIGVKDSKLLEPRERARQYPKIKKAVAEYGYTKIEAHEIDRLRDRKSLNEIEAMRAAELLNNLKTKPELVYVDSPDILQANFAKRIRKYLCFETTLKTEHKADSNYPIVSAASVLAKVERDNAIKLMARKYGVIGSGYSHDPLTIKFLRKWLENNNSLPPIARKSWDTTKKLLTEKFQTKLF